MELDKAKDFYQVMMEKLLKDIGIEEKVIIFDFSFLLILLKINYFYFEYQSYIIRFLIEKKILS